MGRQFSFFLGPNDALELESLLKARGDVVFLADRPLAPRAKILSSFSGSDHRVLLARQRDLGKITFNPVRNQTFFSTDSYRQNLIECDVNTERHKSYLIEGRLYHVVKYWNEHDQLIEKDPEFVKWAESLYRAVKKSLNKVDFMFYAGNEAIEMRKNGIKFNQLDGLPD